jgi:hypothetical protein
MGGGDQKPVMIVYETITIKKDESRQIPGNDELAELWKRAGRRNVLVRPQVLTMTVGLLMYRRHMKRKRVAPCRDLPLPEGAPAAELSQKGL